MDHIPSPIQGQYFKQKNFFDYPGYIGGHEFTQLVIFHYRYRQTLPFDFGIKPRYLHGYLYKRRVGVVVSDFDDFDILISY